MRSLVSIPAGLSDDELDAFSIEIYECNRDEKSDVYKRFHSYAGSEHILAIEKLTNRLVELNLSVIEQLHWLDVATDILVDLQDSRRFDVLDRLFQKKIELSEDKVVILHKCVSIFNAHGETQRLQEYCAALLDMSIQPSVDVQLLLKIFEHDPRRKAAVYDLAAQSQSEKDIAAKWYRLAAESYALVEDGGFNRERCLGHMISLIAVTLKEVLQFRGLVESSDNWQLYANVAREQVELTSDIELRKFLLQDTTTVCQENLDDISGALHAAEKLALLTDSHDAKFILAEIAAKSNDKQRARNALVQCLKDEACIRETERFRLTVERLVAVVPNVELLSYIFPHIEKMGSSGEAETAGRLSDLLMSYGHDSRELREFSFMGSLYRFDPNEAGDKWVKLMLTLDKVEKVSEFLDWTKAKLVDSFVDISWDELVAYAVQSESIGEMVPEVSSEFTVLAALDLFSSDTFSDLAFKVLNEAHSLNPSDHRVWIPLYLLAREYESDNEIADLLSSIIPFVIRSPDVIGNYPVTVESLQAEYRRIVGEDHKSFVEEKSVESLIELEVEPTEQLTIKIEETSSRITSETAAPASTSAKASETVFGDWRSYLLEARSDPGITKATLDRAFDTAIEKHIALQSVALQSAELSELQSWHWQIWRDPDQYGYNRSGRETLPGRRSFATIKFTSA